jgi:hypothetical protein
MAVFFLKRTNYVILGKTIIVFKCREALDGGAYITAVPAQCG